MAQKIRFPIFSPRVRELHGKEAMMKSFQVKEYQIYSPLSFNSSILLDYEFINHQNPDRYEKEMGS